MCVCVGLWWSLYFQELLLQLHDLPFALLGMIGEFDGDSEQGEAASALQTALKRHVITRCEDPRHTSRTNTPAKAPCCATSVLSQASEGCQMRGRVDPPDRPETSRDNPLRGPTAYLSHEYASEGPVLCYQCPVTSIRGVSNAGRHGPSTSTVSSQSTGGKRGGVRGRSGTLRDRIICYH